MEYNFDINKYNQDLLDEELSNTIPQQPYAYYCVLVRSNFIQILSYYLR